MSQVCNQCSRVNPSNAAYCYFDGVRLAGAGAGPLNAATQNFPSQFVFPNGLGCRNFDQLALACQNNWAAALDMLKSGLLANFFGGLGRADLAMAAQEAGRFPDQDRGLDQLLAKLPSQSLQNPKLKAEPSDINLGQIAVGTDRMLELHLANHGMRLLYGSIASDSKWLTLGEGQGQPQKLFQFGAESVVHVQVRGQHLRAGTKPMEGQLLIESNGGNYIINVRATVPITPFKEGVLAGSLTPREIAKKAKAQPSEAAPLFEKGAVASWFQSNGWIYPVQGPSADGLGAVQQFFEALGLAKAPKVDISAQVLTLKGDPGKSVQTTLEVSTQEKKPVYAHATCDQPWVDVSKVKLAGRLATITVAIPSVPPRPGETLKTNIHVQGNGNQRFTVPLTLTISGVPVASAPEMIPAPEPFASLSSPAPAATSGSPFDFNAAPSPASPRSQAPAFASLQASPETRPAPAPRTPRQHLPAWAHLVPLAVLFLILTGLLLRDLFAKEKNRGAPPVEVTTEIDPTARLAVMFDYKPGAPAKEGYFNELNYGVLKREPNGESKKLTFAELGTSNFTMLKVDGTVSKFGKKDTRGSWLNKPEVDGYKFARGTWVIDKVHFTQEVKLHPGEPIAVGQDDLKRYWDTCLVTYTIKNTDERPHDVGMRILLDTYIGENDGVPFTIPGVQGLVSTHKEFKTPSEVPDFLMALEHPSLEDPGTVAQLNLRLGAELEPPGRVLLTNWPGKKGGGFKPLEQWEVPLVDIGNDSAVVLYWNAEKLEPGKTRKLGFTYGLGTLEGSKGGQLALTVGGAFVVGGELSVVALVNSTKADEKVTLKLPKDFTLVTGTETQPVPPAHKDADGKLRPAPITWRIRAGADGTFPLRVDTTSVGSQLKKVVIRKTSIF